MRFLTLRRELAHPRTSVQLCLLGIIAGICSAGLIILFRLCIELAQSFAISQLLNHGVNKQFVWAILPFVAVGCIAISVAITGFKHYRLGIPFVIHRIKFFYGHIPLRTTINQFFGGLFALAGGFVVGREGPSVHLGAAGSSFLGQWFKLPSNSIRILSGCGIAAGISASFNTPFAAVIFVMEVVIREYRVHLFVPVMLAAACGSVLTRIVFGEDNELSFLSFTVLSQWMYFYLVLFGLALGVLASLFNRLVLSIMTMFAKANIVWRLLLAAAITALAGMYFPQALGTSFEQTHHLIEQNTVFSVIFVVLLIKFLLAVTAIGLGIPGGIIGPVMVIGMLAGSVLLIPISYWLSPDEYTTSFALLGIAGMLAAVLHAPLAALSAVMELSYSPEIILPAMLVIVPSYVISTQFLKSRSIFIQQLDFQALPYAVSSIRETLEKTGVLAAMEAKFSLYSDQDKTLIKQTLSDDATALVIQTSSINDLEYQLVEYDVSLELGAEPLRFHHLQGLDSQATLAEVYEILRGNRSGAVYIYDDAPDKIIGVITWNILQGYLQQGQY